MRRMIRTTLAITALLASVVTSACRPDDQRTDSLDPNTAGRTLTPAAAAQLDSGNAAYRMELYESALRHYSRVTELAEDEASGWFGLFMAHTAMGNDSAAAASLERARDIAPGASLIHGLPADTAADPGSDGGVE